jgi:phosphoribosyl 1,2-cyclic phosphate phosphodiesterase
LLIHEDREASGDSINNADSPTGANILIDAGPEFRLQGLAAGLQRLDAVLITHAHADHVHGLDDVRPLTRKNPLAVWASEEDAAELHLRFSYAFGDGQAGGGKPRLDLRVIPDKGIRIGMLEILPIPTVSASWPTLPTARIYRLHP